MRICVLVANTDRSEFSKRFEDDGQKFETLLRAHRPNWTFEHFQVADSDFPSESDRFDGYIITGSPASVHDDNDWIARLDVMIRQIDVDRTPLFGACFGHQAIARALGGQVDNNPAGWVLGYTETQPRGQAKWIGDAGGKIGLYAAHNEQVTSLPVGARVLSCSDDCAVGSFAIGNRVFTTQYHPEMTKTFITALVEEIAGEVGEEVANRSRLSLSAEAETERYALWIVRFLEQAATD